ncbi:acyl carrier protein [Corallococcus sp. BB11-1]|uniref:acyl carrier protein n=1 Tax=Corallococcus sp. BB11-1 TaxID=2996783 RepID=UPI00226ED8AA|nr:acyl carrier protein [Corallococcus sp. BB11-1]MCY1033272.1 acyl carrier protein [Corallococcus sp. BB11-1]
MFDRQSVRDHLARLIAQAMYMEENELVETELFSNFGLESLTLAKIVTKINQEYHVSIQPRDVLKHQTLRDASEFVFQELSRQHGQSGGTP